MSCLISCKIDGCTAQQISFMHLFIYFVSKIPQMMGLMAGYSSDDTHLSLWARGQEDTL